MQVNGYLLVLTAAYPYLGPCRVPGLAGPVDLPSPPPLAPEPGSAFG
jgi:hypothetical protein